MNRLCIALVLLSCSTPDDAVQQPPPGALQLTAGALVPFQPAVFEIDGLTPGARVLVGSSEDSPGAGPCPSVLGGTCLEIVSPTLLGSATADATGRATVVATMPNVATLCLQAAEPGSTSTSNVLCDVVAPPETTGNTVGLRRYTRRAEPGYTLFDPLTGTTTVLIDTLGRELHRWEHSEIPASISYLTDDGTLLRASEPVLPTQPILSNGGKGGRIQELAWDGTLLWESVMVDNDFRYHHDVSRLPNGNVLAIAWERIAPIDAAALGRRNSLMPTVGVWPDVIFELEPNGNGGADIVWEWHASDHLIQDADPSAPNFGDPADHPERIDFNFVGGPVRGDWMHANAIDYDPVHDQILLSVNYFHELWVIDHSTTTAEAASSTGGAQGRGGDILFRWGNPEVYSRGTSVDRRLGGQHDTEWIPPGVPGAGDILVFNNSTHTGDSEVIQITPPRLPGGGYQWPGPGDTFAPAQPTDVLAAPQGGFYADFVSGAQRLPGGGTLVTDGPTGTLIELDANRRLVWLYTNPISGGTALSQGDIPPPGGRGLQNRVFRGERIPASHPGLAGRTLIPGDSLVAP